MELSKYNQGKILTEALEDFKEKETRKEIFFKNTKKNTILPYKILLIFYKNDDTTPDLCWIHLRIIFKKDLVAQIFFNFSNKYLTSQSFLNKLKSIFDFRINFSEYEKNLELNDDYIEEILIKKLEKRFEDYKDFRVH